MCACVVRVCMSVCVCACVRVLCVVNRHIHREQCQSKLFTMSPLIESFPISVSSQTTH